MTVTSAFLSTPQARKDQARTLALAATPPVASRCDPALELPAAERPAVQEYRVSGENTAFSAHLMQHQETSAVLLFSMLDAIMYTVCFTSVCSLLQALKAKLRHRSVQLTQAQEVALDAEQLLSKLEDENASLRAQLQVRGVTS